MITHDAKIRRHPKAVFRDLEDSKGGVLLHLESGQYHGLNAVGSVIWSLLDGTRTADDVVAAVRAQVDDPPASLRDEVMAFLQHLTERNLIEIAPN